MKKFIFILGILLPLISVSQNQTINGNLHLTVGNEGNLRIGKIGDIGNRYVPVGQVTAQYYIDFSGYRDVATNQIGARIAAVRFNKYQENNALVQNTALVFYTNSIGGVVGSTELVERMRITPEGNIGVGTGSPKNKLEVNGTIRAKEVKIEATGWADFVFAEDYKLPALSDVESHIKEHKHLRNIPSASEVKENGVDVGEMQMKLLQKIEELTLYVIELKEEIDNLKSK